MPRPQQSAPPSGEDSAHALVRELAARVAGVAVGRVHLAHHCPQCGSDRHGVPVVLADSTPVAVSLSRAPGMVAAAASPDAAVGIDIERAAAAAFTGFADVAVHPDEHPPTDAAQATRLWVRKEAVLKALGRGLRIDPRRIRLADGDSPAVLAWPDDRSPAEVELVDLPAGPDYMAALAVIGGRGAAYTQVSIRPVTSARV